jgi:hypothetical protein
MFASLDLKPLRTLNGRIQVNGYSARRSRPTPKTPDAQGA